MRLSSYSNGNINVLKYQLDEFNEYTQSNKITIKKICSTYTIDVVDCSKFTDIGITLSNFGLRYTTTGSGQSSEITKLDKNIMESNPTIFKPMNS